MSDGNISPSSLLSCAVFEALVFACASGECLGQDILEPLSDSLRLGGRQGIRRPGHGQAVELKHGSGGSCEDTEVLRFMLSRLVHTSARAF